MLHSTCHKAGVADPTAIEELRRSLAAIMERRNVKPTTLSLQVGKSPTLVKDLLEKTDDAKLSTIYKLAKALNVSPTELIDGGLDPLPAGPQIYLKGEVAAGSWIEAMEWPRDDWQAMTGRPDIIADTDHRFFLRVKGDSMDQVYPDGTLIECVSLFGRIDVAPGKKVVAIRKRADQLVEATVKELVEIDDALWLVPRSSNPQHQSYRLDDPGDGVEEVRLTAVVVSSMRPE